MSSFIFALALTVDLAFAEFLEVFLVSPDFPVLSCV